MNLKKIALLTALSTTALVPANSASALFGFTCIPRLQNCWCTYLIPCPVIDPGNIATTGSIKSTLDETNDVLKDNTKAMLDRTMAMGADIGGLLPGLNSIGLNFENLLQSQIDEITGTIEGLRDQIANINLAAQDLQGILTGQIHPSVLADKLAEAGMTAVDLQKLGMKADTINNLLNGNLSPKDLLSVAGSLDLQGELLKGAGLTPDALKSLAAGTLDLSSLESQLKSAANLDLSDLSAAGIDIGSLESLAGSFDEAQIMSVIGELGIGELGSMSELTQLSSIISGDLDASTIFSLAGSAGIQIGDLESLGVNASTIDAFRSGSFSADQFLEMSGAIGFGGDALKSLGIDAESIMAVANGDMSPERILQIAQQSGLSSDGLRAAGLDINQIAALAQSGSISDAMRLAEGAGLATNPLANLGISSDQLAGIIDGSVSPQEIGAILAQQGIDPSAIILPTADGVAVNGLGEAVENFRTTYNIPVDSISGLRDALQNARFDFGSTSSIDAQSLLANLSDVAGFDLQSQDFLNNLVSGQTLSSDLMSFLDTQGLGAEQLGRLGISSEAISAFQSGSFTPDQLLNFTRNLGLGEQALESLGIGGSALADIASGISSPADLLARAGSLGLDTETLRRMGMSETALEQVAAEGTQDAAQSLADTVAGPAPENIQVPVSTGSPLAAAMGAVTNTPNAPGTLGASCTNQQTLLSVQAEPNFFGNDVAQIDMAISQGDIHSHEESIADAMRLANKNQSHVIARSIQVKNILTDALDSLDYFVNEIKSAETLEDDHKVNVAVETQLLMARAEVTSLLTFLASTNSASIINEDTFTATPTFPHGSQWQEIVEERAQERAEQIAEPARASAAAAAEYTNFSHQAQETVNGLEALESYNGLQDTMPDLIDSIMEHEQMKSHLHMLETMVRDVASELFVPADQESAAELMLNDLRSRAGEYGPESRWQESSAVANSIQAAAISGSSRYGERIVIQAAGRDEPARLSAPAGRPYSYGQIDSQNGGDPYDIIEPSISVGREEDREPPPPLAGLFQYFLEAYRREVYYGDMRRGESPDTMSLRVWEEMTLNAPECLIGPVETNEQNLSARPDLFDLSPYCEHLYFAGGDVEDYIPSGELGGTDAVLWESKIRADSFELRYGTADQVIERAQNLLDDPYTQEVIDLVTSDGHPDLLRRAEEIISTIDGFLTGNP